MGIIGEMGWGATMAGPSPGNGEMQRRVFAGAELQPAAGGPPAGIDADGAADAADDEGAHHAPGLADGPADGGADVRADEDEEFHARRKKQEAHPGRGGGGSSRFLGCWSRNGGGFLCSMARLIFAGECLNVRRERPLKASP